MPCLADHLNVAVVAAVLAIAAPAFAMDMPTTATETPLDDQTNVLPDTALTRSEWKQRVEQAKIRAKEFGLLARAGLLKPAGRSAQEIAIEASADALNDQNLRPGDILSTVNGLVVYRGQSGTERKPSDFEPVSPGYLDRLK